MSNLSSIPGTNVPPVSFPGIASGIDYNSIITKLTSLTLAPATQLNQQIATVNAANAELIKINNLLSSVQTALTGLSDANLYDAVSATSSNTAFLTAQGITGGNATPGTYTITATTLATATQVVGAASIGHTELDAAAGTTASGADVPLIDSWAAITPSNGSGSQGTVTVDGVQIAYDVNTESLNQILATINNAVHAAGDATFNIGLVAGTDQVQITDSAHPVSLGSTSDQGNLLQVLRLDQAQVSNTATAGTVTGTAGVGGLNQALEFNSANGVGGAATDANYTTPVTSGYFTINGVQINVDATTDNLHSVINRINSSSAGVVAAYNTATGQITLTSKSTGAQSIVVGSSGDTSNFLTATGLTTASGAATTVGQQASVTLQTAGGGTQTVYSNSNTVTNAISGVQLNLLSNASSSFQVTVAQDTSSLTNAINSFVSAYNAAIDEINNATAPPVVPTSPAGSGVGTPPAAPIGAGVLFGNADVSIIKDTLVNEVTAILPNNGSGYTSLSQIGLNLTDSFTQLQQNTSGGTGSGTISAKQMQGTDGQLQPLDASKLSAAFAANPTAVQDLLNGSQGLVTTMGTYLTGVTGLPTQTSTGLLGTVPSISLLQGFENTNTSLITSIQQQITQIHDNANMQADQLRAEFVQTETSLAGYQALQQQLGSFFKGSGG